VSGPHQDLDPASPGHRFYDVSAISLNQALGTHVHAHTHTHTCTRAPDHGFVRPSFLPDAVCGIPKSPHTKMSPLLGTQGAAEPSMQLQLCMHAAVVLDAGSDAANPQEASRSGSGGRSL